MKYKILDQLWKFRACVILVSVVIVFHPQHILAEEEPIYVELRTGEKQIEILINTREFTIQSAASWFKTLSETFGKGGTINIRCDPDIQIGPMIEFLNAIDASSWKGIVLFCAPKVADDWRTWMRIGKGEKVVPLVIKPSPTAPARDP